MICGPAFIEIDNNFPEGVPIYKSKLIIGNITIRFTKKFNWFNRFMLKLIFGLNVKNIKNYCNKNIERKII